MTRKPNALLMSGAKLAAARRAATLTQADVATRAGVTLSNVKRIEQRENVGVFPSTLHALADAVGVPSDSLLAGKQSGKAAKPTPQEMKLDDVLAWLDRQRLDVVGEVLEHAGSILDLAASANGRRRQSPPTNRPSHTS